jgi:hypothetical protein
VTKYEIRCPGSFRSGVAFLDLETVKVPAPEDYRMPSGEALRNRWSVALAGVARDGSISIVDPAGDEALGLEELAELLAGAESVAYGATREFDEMICRGRFTNARRAHLPVPTFPAVPGAEALSWRNVGVAKSYGDEIRGDDILSREVPRGLYDGRRDAVMVHLLRDVAELILRDGEPDEACRDWCEWVLVNFDFALLALQRVGAAS